MGSQVQCKVRYGKKTSEGNALLETEELIFRGDFRLTIPFKDIQSVEAKDGQLYFAFAEESAIFDLGPFAEKWAAKIRKPKSLIDKLGVKPDFQVAVLHVADDAFWTQLKERTTNIATGKSKPESDIIFLGAETKTDLRKLASLPKSIKKNGAIWVIWPKGRPELKEDDVRAAAIAAGLVDVKVVKFSDSHSGLKLVIPVARR